MWRRSQLGWDEERDQMLATLRRYGIRDERVLAAMAGVPRHRFIPDEYRAHDESYADHPCPIGHRQTISQPFIVAYMTALLELRPGEKVLEIGVGSGYQQAILAALGVQCYGVERIGALATCALSVLREQGCNDIHVRVGDGYLGWSDEAPFDAIMTTCAAPGVPPHLVAQLSESGGRMILPVGVDSQYLVRLVKHGTHVDQKRDIAVRFVPMVPGGE